MPNQYEILNALNGEYGSQAILPADDNLIVTTTNMKNGTYTIAAQPKSACRISVTITAVGTADTMGTLTYAGTDENGDTITEAVSPIADSTVYTSKHFKTISSVTGAGWVIDAVEGTEDTIIVGVDYSQVIDNHYIFKISVVTQAVVASQTDVEGSTNAKLSAFTALAVNNEQFGKWTNITLTSGEAIGYYMRG